MKDSKNIRANITSINDIKKIEEQPNVKYLNIDIMNPDLEVIYYLIDHGQKYSYSELIDDKKGYIYVPHEIFKHSMLFLLNIINHVPTSLTEIEIARYLYITIGKNIGYDINILPDKNEIFTLKNINIINNIWGSINITKATNISFCKLYLYLCRLMNIECKLITTGQIGYQKNMLTIDNTNIIVDITQDIPYIQAGFKTNNFPGYNDDIEIDKKIFYIQDSYSEHLIEKQLKHLDYSKDDIFKDILLNTQYIIKAETMKPIELGIIYDLIFTKYYPNQEISINNLYIQNMEQKEHFILITHNQKYYSYNYTQNSFVEIPKSEIEKNFAIKKIGTYLNEKVPLIINSQESY